MSLDCLWGQTTKQEPINFIWVHYSLFCCLDTKPNWHHSDTKVEQTATMVASLAMQAYPVWWITCVERKKRHHTAVLCNRCSALAVQVACQTINFTSGRAKFLCGKLCMLQFPELIGFIQGEESNLFTNTLGETIEVKVMSTQDETAELLSKVIYNKKDLLVVKTNFCAGFRWR